MLRTCAAAPTRRRRDDAVTRMLRRSDSDVKPQKLGRDAATTSINNSDVKLQQL